VTDAESYRLLREACGATWIERDAVRVAGPEAVAYLQGQVSQDVENLAVGATAWTLVLQPQGKVDAWARVRRTAGEELVLDVDGGFGEALLDRLRRFKLRVKAEIDALDWKCLAVRGPETPVLDGTPFPWDAFAGVDLLAPDPAPPPGVLVVEPQAYEVCRIEAGIPRMGTELTDRTIPAEAGLVGTSVSFTKGCYTGQELVARIDSRGGHVPRHLRGLVLGGMVDVGTPVEVGGRQVGAVTSVAAHPAGHTVALAYVSRDVSPPADAVCAGEAASVRPLPLLS
jgi:folate-binding protein YgfZ